MIVNLNWLTVVQKLANHATNYQCYSRIWKVIIVKVLYNKKITVVFDLKEYWVSTAKKVKKNSLIDRNIITLSYFTLL